MSRINIFWDWFGTIADSLAADPHDSSLLSELDRRVLSLAPGLSWEIGPGLSKPWQLVISPDLNRDLRETAKSIVARAPSLDQWEFHPARQPKEWEYKFEFTDETGAERLMVDATNWRFVLLRHQSGIREMLLLASELSALSDVERWQAGAILLEGILGEDVFLDAVDEFEVVNELEPRFAAHARSIRDLRAAAIGKVG
jgi:hypothetical protein